MKKFSKILSSVLATSMLVSVFAMNAMAASKAHTVTIAADKTEGLVAGDTVALNVTIDNTAKLTAVEYTLKYDTSVFTAETEKVSKVEKCVDKDWLTEIKKEDGGSVGDYWAYYLGTPTYNVTTPGEIYFGWAGGANGGIGKDDPDNEIKDNRLIGKFNLKVNDNAVDGTYTILLVGNTMDEGENFPTDMVCVPVKVTVGKAAAPQSFNAKVPYGAKAQAAEGIKFNLTTDDVTKNVKTVDYKVPFFKTEDDKSEIENIGNIAVGLTINGVPSGVTVKANSAELY